MRNRIFILVDTPDAARLGLEGGEEGRRGKGKRERRRRTWRRKRYRERKRKETWEKIKEGERVRSKYDGGNAIHDEHKDEGENRICELCGNKTRNTEGYT